MLGVVLALIVILFPRGLMGLAETLWRRLHPARPS
jgi:hypothetical protein